MRNIITALGNPKINEELKKEEFNVLAPDIQYQEGVIEILEKNKDTEILILNSILPGERSLQDFINKIKEINFIIEIIIILEKENIEMKNFLISKGIFNIFYNNKITIKEIIYLLKENKNKIPEEINEEIKLLKEMILNNQNKNKKEKEIIKNIKKIINKIVNKKKNKKNNFTKNKVSNKANKIKTINNKIISITGTAKTGKTIISAILLNVISNKKTILIDFDFLNNNISTIFGTNKLPKIMNQKIKENKLDLNKISIEDLIIKIDNNLNLICGIDLLLNNKINNNAIKNIIKEATKKYDIIIIDTPSDINNICLKQIIENSNQVVLIIEPNLLGIKNSRQILETYINRWKIEKEKINILFNKNNINSISNLILNQMFSDFNILGKITLNKNYDLIINKNKFALSNKIKKEYLNITNKLNIN